MKQETAILLLFLFVSTLPFVACLLGALGP